MRPAVPAIVACLLLGANPSPAPAEVADPAAVVRAAAQHFDEGIAGIIIRRSSTTQHASAGLASTSSAEIEYQILNGYETVEIRIVSAKSDGKTVDAGGLATDSKKRNDDLHGGQPFRWPYQLRAMADYRYTTAPCADCSAGIVAIAFASEHHDRQHGSGVMRIDERTNRVVSVKQDPYVQNQSNIDASTQTIEFGENGTFWVPVRAAIDFKGHFGFFKGNGTAAFVYSGYERFPSLDAAREAAKAGS